MTDLEWRALSDILTKNWIMWWDFKSWNETLRMPESVASSIKMLTST